MSVYTTIKRQASTADVKLPPPPGEALFVGSGGATQSFVVPSGVYSICVVAVSVTAATACRLHRSGVDLINTTAAIGTGNNGGGNGGAVGNNDPFVTGYDSYRAGGGAGGYSGNGGQGGTGSLYTGAAGFSGSGGGGGGGQGYSGNGSNPVAIGGSGGGVGLFGQSANGAGGSEGAKNGQSGSQVLAPYVGGASTNAVGGNLRYRNNISVTPGETLTVVLGSTVATTPRGPGMRIIWGAGRAFPTTDCGPTVPKGQAYFTTNTTWTVPANVTAISIACQQNGGSSVAVEVIAAAATVVRAENGNRIGTNGGDGGYPGQAGSTDSGGGGAGGYFGNGGNGGAYTVIANGAWACGNGSAAATDSSGAGGGASAYRVYQGSFGGGGSPMYSSYAGGRGGDVGIEGATPGQGAGGTQSSPAGVNAGIGVVCGFKGGAYMGGRGGAFAWLGTLAVTPGQVLTINAAGGRARIVWGPGRSYPYNAGEI